MLALLICQVLNSHLELIKRVLHTEQVVKVEWEVDDSFFILSHVGITNMLIALLFILLHKFILEVFDKQFIICVRVLFMTKAF